MSQYSSPQFERLVEQSLGRSIEEIRQTPQSDLDAERRAQHGPLSVVSMFPLIGRGHPLRDRLVSHAEADRAMDEALETLAALRLPAVEPPRK